MKTKKEVIGVPHPQDYLGEKKEVKDYLDEVYAIGFKNGQIEMRNRVLMKINRGVKFWIGVKADYVVDLLKIINKLPLTKDITKIN